MKHPCPKCNTYPKIDNRDFNFYFHSECLCKEDTSNYLKNYFIRNAHYSDAYLIYFGFDEQKTYFIYDFYTKNMTLKLSNDIDMNIKDIKFVELLEKILKEKDNIYIEQIFDYLVEKYLNNLIFA